MSYSDDYFLRTNRMLLYNIMPIANLPSVFKYGVLSNNEMQKKNFYISVADPEVQAIREGVTVPNKLSLHSYANLYFDAHNPMLSRLRPRNNELCVLGIDISILNEPGVVLSDMNAARSMVAFYDVKNGIKMIEFEKVFQHYWTSPDALEEYFNKGIKCAEILIPNRVRPSFIKKIFVINESVKNKILAHNCINIEIDITPGLFF